MDSWELLRRLAAASPDDPLWTVLFQRCDVLIRTALRSQFAGRRRPDVGQLDDLAQDVMERLLVDGRKVITRFSGTRDEIFSAYIRRIAENILLDQFRRSSQRQAVETSFPSDEPWRFEAALAESPIDNVGGDPASGVELREMTERVEQVLSRISLDDRQRAQNRLLFQLYFRDGCSIPQIARLRAVALSASSVARRITLIRKELRTSFAARRLSAETRPTGEPRRRTTWRKTR